MGPTTARLNSPNGLVVDGSGNAYMAEQVNQRIRLVTVSTGLISTHAGNGRPGSDAVQSAPNSSLWLPISTKVDAGGNVFVDDYFNNRIRVVSTNGSISTITGRGISGFSGDGGDATLAAIKNSAGIVLGASGNLIFNDSGNNHISNRNASNRVIATIAETGEGSSRGDGGASTAASVNSPFGLAIRSGTLAVSELLGNHIRVVADGGTVAFSAGTGARRTSRATAARRNRRRSTNRPRSTTTRAATSTSPTAATTASARSPARPSTRSSATAARSSRATGSPQQAHRRRALSA